VIEGCVEISKHIAAFCFGRRGSASPLEDSNLKVPVLLCLALAAIAVFLAPHQTNAQSAAGAGSASATPATPQTSSPKASQDTEPVVTYVRPTERQKIRNFAFDAFGPYAFAGAAIAGGFDQAETRPPEWGQGWDAYGVRVANSFGISLVTTSTRYGLAEAFREDTLYYRCGCRGFFPRLEHAMISTVTARRGSDGHRAFSFPAVAAPYAGTMTATLGWYPARFSPMDGFRMGSYNLLGQAAQNLAFEFIYGGPHTLLGRTHIPVVSKISAQPTPGARP
jgi:hypothetical protein